MAVGLGAQVTVLDINHERLKYLDDIYRGSLQTRNSDEYNIEDVVFQADLVIGAVLIPGGRAPWLITRDMLKHMRRGSVIVDVAVDQGGCVETDASHHAQQPHLRGRRRGALLRGEHAGGGAAHQHLRPQ